MKTTLNQIITSASSLLLLLLLTLSGTAVGQNLIKNTQAGVVEKVPQKPNRIAEWLATQQSGSTTDVQLFDLTKRYQQPNHEAHVKEAVYLTIDEDQLMQLTTEQPKTITLSIPVAKDRMFDVELALAENVADDFLVKTSGGKTFTQAEIGGVFYRGIVKGDGQSIVALSVFPDYLQLVIGDKDGNYVVAKLPNEKRRTDRYVLYAENDLLNLEKSECKAELKKEEGEEIEGVDLRKFGIRTKNEADRLLEVYIECDNSLYNVTGGSAVNAARYTQSVFNTSATVYQNEGIDKKISQIFVWTEEDPFSDLNFSSQILDAFVLSKASTGFEGNFAHIVTARLGPQGIAAAFDSSLPFSLTGFIGDWTAPFPTPSLDSEIFAHEMGHNMGSLHTHGCYWNSDTYGNGTQIDDCGNANRIEIGNSAEGSFCVEDPLNPILPEEGGTIMSYCSQDGFFSDYMPGTNLNIGFAAQPGDVIRMGYFNPSPGTSNLIGGQPNLNCTSIDSISIGEDSIQLFGIRVENQGDFPADASTVGIFLSFDPLIYPGTIRLPFPTRGSDRQIGSVAIGGLSTGASVTIDATVAAPDVSFQAGQYFIGAYANIDRTVPESNVGDNGIAFLDEPIILETRLSCLATGNLTVDSSTVTLSDIQVQNSGAYRSPFTRFSFYLSSDSMVNPFEDIFITNAFVFPIEAGGIGDVATSFDLTDFSVPAGDYFLSAVLDPFNFLPDSTFENRDICVLDIIPYTVKDGDQFCADEVLTAPSGTVSDGSGIDNTQIGTFCTKLIIPEGGGQIDLNFTELDLRTAFDFVIFLDGAALTFENAVGAFTGDMVPDSTITTQDTLQILYIGGPASEGWVANYNTTQVTDLELSIATADPSPAAFSKTDYTFTVENTGSIAATGIVVKQNLANGQMVLVGGSEVQASAGSYNRVNSTWTIPELAPGESATLVLNLFNLTTDFDLFAQIIAADQEDADSTPGNGSCCEALEDDEAVLSNDEEMSAREAVDTSPTQVEETFVIQGVYPNPVQAESTILFFNDADQVRMSIHDVNGRVVLQEQWRADKGFNVKRLDMSTLPGGVYYLNMNNAAPQRIVKVQ
jgi:hypothetical protein